MTDYIQVKEGVDLSNLEKPLTSVLWAIAAVFERNGVACVITSARRPATEKKSFHALGRALDFRANHIGSRNLQLKILAELIGALGDGFDVILHGEGMNLHYHVEYDPKG